MLALILASIAGLCFFGSRLSPWIFIPLAPFAFGYLYFAIVVLVIHEGSHNMFVICKDKKKAMKWNRVFGEVASLPFGIPYRKHWEEGHYTHHNHPVEDLDPQNCHPRTGPELFKFVAKLTFIPGYALLRASEYFCPAEIEYRTNRKLLAGQAALWIFLTAISAVYLHWSIPVAAILGMQVALAINEVKVSMEHGGEIGREENPMLRSCSSFFPLRPLLMPFNISLHFEHHLHFFVPWYDLPEFHREIEKIVPEEVKPYLFNRNGAVWTQILGKKPTFDSKVRSLVAP